MSHQYQFQNMLSYFVCVHFHKRKKRRKEMEVSKKAINLVVKGIIHDLPKPKSLGQE